MNNSEKLSFGGKLKAFWNAMLMRILVWRLKHLSNRSFVILLGALIGIITGLAASFLKFAISNIRDFLTGGFDFQYVNLLYIAYPLLGIVITVFVARFILNEKSSHGVTDIIYAISKGSSKLAPLKMVSRMVTSAITTGFGGSVGIEAPISVTGAAIGSNMGQAFRLNYKSRSLLIGCGSASAIAAMFNAPIAGVIFTIEIILTEVTISSFIPLLIASVAGALVASAFSGGDSIFVYNLDYVLELAEIPWFITLGVLAGLISLYFIRINTWVESISVKIKRPFSKAIVGGLGLGLLIFVFPPIYGEGYNSIRLLLDGEVPKLLNSSFFAGEFNNSLILMLFLGFMILVKPLATAMTISAGGGGGVFAPSLFVGGITGFTFATGFNLIYPDSLSPASFTLVGMCGVMSEVLHAPLTAIFLIAELTQGYSLFIPLMLVSAISYSTIYYFEKNSIYTKKLIEQGDLILDNKDLQVLSLMELEKLIEMDLLTIGPNAMLRDLVGLVKKSKRNIFPVIDENGALMGIVTLDDIREIMFDPKALDEVTVRSVMHKAPNQIHAGDNMQMVMAKFENSGAWNLPVINEGAYIGLLSKSTIFNAYRKKLVRQDKA